MSNGKRILVIDDESFMVNSLCRFLTGKGYDTSATTAPLEALDLIDSEQFDVVITDLRMKPMGGIDILKKLQQSGFKGKTIAMSAFHSDFEEELKALKVDAVLEKPFELSDLHKLIESSPASSAFEKLLEESVKTHGHLCPGQVLGVRMAMLGLGEIGIEDPRGKDRKNLIVFVEMDRCATDAIQSVTGCSLGHRTMKFMDYGKMAATFLNLKTGKAVRIVALEEARAKAKKLFPEIVNRYSAQIEAYKIMPDNELFDIMDVEVRVKPEDMPGRPLARIKCDVCGEYVQDMREVRRDGKVLCKPCAEGGYYVKVDLKK